MTNQNGESNSLNSEQGDPAATAKILWIAFLFSVGSFVAILVMTVTDPEPLTLDPEVFIFGFLAVTNAALSFLLPKMMSPKPAPEHTAPPKQGFGPKDFTPFVVRVALSESVAVFGLTLGMLKQNIEVAAPFFVISFFCVLMAKPKS